MKKIASFTVNHLTLLPGLYVSRKDLVNKEIITTFDIRITRPNFEPVIDNPALHAIEHLGATFLRNHEVYKNDIIYFGPMGCRTGFYFIVRDNMTHEEVIKLIQETCLFVSEYNGEIPGIKKEECGNYLDHDLKKAKNYAYEYYNVIKNYTVEQLDYDYKTC